MNVDSAAPVESPKVDVAFGVQPIRGEVVSGDRCAVWAHDSRLILAVADGLGHGPGAARAAEAALQCIERNLTNSCEVIFDHCDQALRATRGVALALALVDLKRDLLSIASVGNIRAVLVNADQDLRLGGACGIVGGGFKSLSPETHRLAEGDKLCLYTDGFDELLPLREHFRAVGPGNIQACVDSAINFWASGRDDAGLLLYCHRASESRPS